jgi:hypothetical protein
VPKVAQFFADAFFRLGEGRRSPFTVHRSPFAAGGKGEPLIAGDATVWGSFVLTCVEQACLDPIILRAGSGGIADPPQYKSLCYSRSFSGTSPGSYWSRS